jgi:DNA-binding transcriptional MerR regulator
MSERKRGQAAALRPVEPAQTLEKLRLTAGKAAELCGVSRRQLCYWADTGIISGLEAEEGEQAEGEKEKDGSRRIYDFPALEKVMLIKQALDDGPGLRRAAQEVSEYLAGRREKAKELVSSFGEQRESFLLEQGEQLEKLARRARNLAPRLGSRDKLLALHSALEPLDRLQERISGGELLLEEDVMGCLRLAESLEQAEARLWRLEPAPAAKGKA